MSPEAVKAAGQRRGRGREHWALFRFRSGSPLKCVATASKRDKAAAKENCERIVGRCYSVDPSPKVASMRLSAPTLTKMAIDDIEDPQYRHCFELRASSNLHAKRSLASIALALRLSSGGPDGAQK